MVSNSDTVQFLTSEKLSSQDLELIEKLNSAGNAYLIEFPSSFWGTPISEPPKVYTQVEDYIPYSENHIACHVFEDEEAWSGIYEKIDPADFSELLPIIYSRSHDRNVREDHREIPMDKLLDFPAMHMPKQIFMPTDIAPIMDVRVINKLPIDIGSGKSISIIIHDGCSGSAWIIYPISTASYNVAEVRISIHDSVEVSGKMYYKYKYELFSDFSILDSRMHLAIADTPGRKMVNQHNLSKHSGSDEADTSYQTVEEDPGYRYANDFMHREKYSREEKVLRERLLRSDKFTSELLNKKVLDQIVDVTSCIDRYKKKNGRGQTLEMISGLRGVFSEWIVNWDMEHEYAVPSRIIPIPSEHTLASHLQCQEDVQLDFFISELRYDLKLGSKFHDVLAD